MVCADPTAATTGSSAARRTRSAAARPAWHVTFYIAPIRSSSQDAAQPDVREATTRAWRMKNAGQAHPASATVARRIASATMNAAHMQCASRWSTARCPVSHLSLAFRCAGGPAIREISAAHMASMKLVHLVKDVKRAPTGAAGATTPTRKVRAAAPAQALQTAPSATVARRFMAALHSAVRTPIVPSATAARRTIPEPSPRTSIGGSASQTPRSERFTSRRERRWRWAIARRRASLVQLVAAPRAASAAHTARS